MRAPVYIEICEQKGEKNHFHSDYELLYTLDGELQLEIQDSRFAIPPDEFYVINDTVPYSSDKSILQIAGDHSFANVASFNKSIKDIHGCTPREFRKSLRNEMTSASLSKHLEQVLGSVNKEELPTPIPSISQTDRPCGRSARKAKGCCTVVQQPHILTGSFRCHQAQ